MLDSRPRRHELDAASSQSLLGPHTVLMRQAPTNDVRHDLSVAVPVPPKASRGLDEVIVHDSHHTEVAAFRVMIFREGKVKARLEPVLVGPCAVGGLIDRISKHPGIRLTDEQSGSIDLIEGHFQSLKVSSNGLRWCY